MQLICPSCDSRYQLKPGAVPPAGRKVRCNRCAHVWFQLPVAESAAEPDASPLTASASADSVESAPPPPAPAASPEPAPEFTPESMPDFDAMLGNNATPAAAQPSKGVNAWAVAAMILVLLLGALVVYEAPLRNMGLDSAYRLAGLHQTDGIELQKLLIQKTGSRRQPKILVQGELFNTGSVTRHVPVIRMQLLNKDGKVEDTVQYQQKDMEIDPDAAIPFSAELQTKGKDVASVRVDIGNPLELSLRK